MKIAIIACMVFSREFNYLTSQSHHVTRTWWLRQGLHDTPDLLRKEVQQTIDQIEYENAGLPASRRFDAIAFGYGLCSNGVLGLKSGELPLIIPRCDDCISLFLGSADRYREQFAKMPGVYWFNPGWVENAFVPTKEAYEERLAIYTEEYGEDNAEFLLESENAWMKNYKHVAYITCPLKGIPDYSEVAKCSACHHGWQYNELEGDISYIEALLNGDWDDARFLTCPPHHTVTPLYDNRKIDCEPTGE